MREYENEREVSNPGSSLCHMEPSPPPSPNETKESLTVKWDQPVVGVLPWKWLAGWFNWKALLAPGRVPGDVVVHLSVSPTP